MMDIRSHVRSPGRSLGIALVAVVMVATSCVIPEQESAQPISVPDDVFVTTTEPEVVTTEPEEVSPVFALSLYWQFQDVAGATRLLRVRRNQESLASPQEALAALVDGPTAEERSEREEVGSFFPRVSAVLSPVVGEPNENGVVRVTFADESGFRENDLDKIPVAEELVCTLTSLPSVNGVVIADSLGEIDLPDRESQPIIGAAARANYNCDQVLDEVEIPALGTTPVQNPEAEAEAEAGESTTTTDG